MVHEKQDYEFVDKYVDSSHSPIERTNSHPGRCMFHHLPRALQEGSTVPPQPTTPSRNQSGVRVFHTVYPMDQVGHMGLMGLVGRMGSMDSAMGVTWISWSRASLKAGYLKVYSPPLDFFPLPFLLFSNT